MRVSIVALNALPAIDSTQGNAVGGMETFAWRFAKGLARDGTSVQFVVRSPCRRTNTVSESVEVHSFCEPFRQIKHSVSRSMDWDSKHRLPKIKRWDPTLAWKIPLLAFRKIFLSAFSEFDSLTHCLDAYRADCLLALGINETSAMMASIAARNQIPLLVWLQSNADLEPKLYGPVEFVDRYGVTNRHGQETMRNTHGIICQTATQFASIQHLKSTAGETIAASTACIHIPNPIDFDSNTGKVSSFDERRGVLWVGRADPFHKRPMLAIEIAKRCPSIPFRMIMNRGDPSIRDQVFQEKSPNVEIKEFLGVERMQEAMRKSRLFLSTGSAIYEGFPNVFLEANANGTPIVSLEDFDDYLQKSAGGRCAEGETRQCALQIEQLYSSLSDWQYCSTKGREYVEKHHDLKHVVTQFRDFANQVASRS